MNFATVQDKSAPVGSMQTCEFSDLAAMLSHAIVSPSKEGPDVVSTCGDPAPSLKTDFDDGDYALGKVQNDVRPA